MVAPPINTSDTWAFVFEKNFKLQSSTVGSGARGEWKVAALLTHVAVKYTYEMVEYEVPATDDNHTAVGEVCAP